MKKYVITFAHLLKVANGKPQFFITSFKTRARTSFGARVQFFKLHKAKRNKILFISFEA